MRLDIFIIIGIIFLTINLVNASFITGNPSDEIKMNYKSGDFVKGWINISLNNEPGNSKLTAFGDEITILDFLNKNDFDCTASARCICQPFDCEKGYSSQDIGTTTKSINLASWEKRLIGVKLTGKVSKIKDFSFNLNSDVSDSCISQLKINFFDNVEWNAGEIKEDAECFAKNPYGCYNNEDSISTNPLDHSKVYCEKINLKGKGFKVGADVVGTGNADFKIRVLNKYCEASIAEEGEFSCIIEFDDEINEEADVCLEIKSGSYSMPYEEISPCGYIGEYNYDFKIFAKPLKYNAIGTININNSLIPGLTDKIENYIFNKYNGNCSEDCFIPLIFSGIEQGITLSDLKLIYNSAELTKIENNFYDLTEEIPIINSDYLKLELEKAKLKVPLTTGTKELTLKLGNNEILEKNVHIEEGVKIKDIIPKEVPALVPVNFIILTEGKSNITYEWDFGDQNEIITAGNKVVHTYKEIGTYELKISTNGQSKITTINVKSPIDSVNKTIENYKNNLNGIKEEIEKLDDWIQDNLKQKTKLNELTAKINEQEARTSDGIDEGEAIDIMKKLLELKIPRKLGIGMIINKIDIIQNGDVLDLSVLKEMGAGDFEKGRAGYISAINNWRNSNLNMRMESKTYTAYFNDGEKDLISYVKIYLDPKKDLGNIYFIVDKEVEFLEEGLKSNIVFEDVSESQIVKFLYPGRVTINNLPIYVSPKESELELSINVGVCDNNGICENGENYGDCPNDCKRWFSSILMLIGLFIFTFIVYIFLQEWYKRYYEGHLFPNKNQLFNLVNFMNNSLNQGIKKSAIFKKLEDIGWKGEQLIYAWRKLHGKRTGMWEIPLFKWVENKQVKKELAKRGGRIILPKNNARLIGNGFKKNIRNIPLRKNFKNNFRRGRGNGKTGLYPK